MVRIELRFPQDKRGLAGYDLGNRTYKEQIEPLYTGTVGKVTLKFPDSVEVVSSSFVHGLFSELVSQKGYAGVKELVNIESVNTDLERMIWDRIY